MTPQFRRDMTFLAMCVLLALFVGAYILSTYNDDSYEPITGPDTHEAQADSPGCFEDEAAVTAPDPDPTHGLTWVCVPLDDFMDEGSFTRLDSILGG